MLFRVVIPKKVQKEISNIDQRYKDRILAVVTRLRSDPFMGKKLDGDHQGQWSYQVWPYRIIYEVHKNELVILLVKIGHRQGVYK